MELRRKLMQKKFSKKVIEQLIIKMKGLNYLDDKKYAELLVNESVNLRHDGLQKVKARLIEKGISKVIISEVVSQMMNDDIEDENVKIVADKKRSSLQRRNLENRELQQKLTAYLLTKGYSFAAIKKYFKDYDEETEFEEEQ
ncbi:hypothetical protein MASR1M107_11150 [Ignavibacteriales bacterium]